MLFSSLLFLFLFLPAVLCIYYLLPRQCRNGFLLLADLIFYGFGEPAFILLMLISIVINFAGGLWIAHSRTARGKKLSLAAALCLNLLLLGIFKYAGFISDTLRLLPAFAGLPQLEIPLPIGISFYTFQAMSYLIDVYRKDCLPQKNILSFGAYISLFPQLIAGPIVRYKDVSDALANPHRESAIMFSDGVELFLVGLSKKALLANPLGALWAVLSENPAAAGQTGAWVGAAAFSLQLYFDFSGYSDMACGLGKMFGFTFCQNFHYPYTAKSISDFWRRWHMSLTTWFRDYVYIPLGGSRCRLPRALLNVAIVWALTGLWHGASWNFVFWGLYYAVLLILEKLFLGKLLTRLPATIGHLYTLFFVVVGWVLFALEDVQQLKGYLSVLFLGGNAPDAVVSVQVITSLPLLIAAVIACLPVVKRLYTAMPHRPRRVLTGICSILAMLLCTASLVSDSYNPFLYFRF